MTLDRQGIGLAILRVMMGMFLLFQGIAKIRWFTDPSLLAGRFSDWMQASSPSSLSVQYLERVAIPYTSILARVVPLAEIVSGLALIVGLWTPVFACVAFFLTLNFAVGSGDIFRYRFLTGGNGLPALGATLALAIGGVQLPLSLRRK